MNTCSLNIAVEKAQSWQNLCAFLIKWQFGVKFQRGRFFSKACGGVNDEGKINSQQDNK